LIGKFRAWLSKIKSMGTCFVRNHDIYRNWGMTASIAHHLQLIRNFSPDRMMKSVVHYAFRNTSCAMQQLKHAWHFDKHLISKYRTPSSTYSKLQSMSSHGSTYRQQQRICMRARQPWAAAAPWNSIEANSVQTKQSMQRNKERKKQKSLMRSCNA
jgi:hypothetical protein